MARELGADLAGLVSVEDLKNAPSFTFAPKMPNAGEGVGTRENELGLKPGEVKWPDNAKTVLVIAVEHPAESPELDWWYGRVDPPGNRVLAKTVRELCEWVPKKFDMEVFHLPYHVEKGGIYLKDAAVLAGLGCLGRHNILVTPEYGSHVRLRAMTLSESLPSTGPSGFNPCKGCEEYCRKACPQGSFDEKLYQADDYDQEILPSWDGTFSRPNCLVQMDVDNDVAKEQDVDGFDKPVKIIKYCRNCEMACPVGRA